MVSRNPSVVSSAVGRPLRSMSRFAASEVYAEGWDHDADESDGIFRRRVRLDNDAGWIAYVVGLS